MSYSPVAAVPPSDSKQGLATNVGQEPTSYSTLPNYQHIHSYPQAFHHAADQPRRKRRSLVCRVFHFLVAGTFAWLVLSLLVKTSFKAAHWIHYHRGHRESWFSAMDDDYEYAVPRDVTLEECIQGGDWTPSDFSPFFEVGLSGQEDDAYPFDYQAETSFSLPISSDTLFFVSRGQLLGGNIQVSTSPDQPVDSATVSVLIRYNHEELLDSTKACLLSRHEGEKGVGVFTPQWRRHRRFPGRHNQVRYELIVVLPELSEDALPLKIKNFETDIINSAHFIEDLNGEVFFDSVSLKGSNGPIKAKSINSTTAKLHTSNGPIYGKFNTTRSLVIETSNSPIYVDVGLESDEDGSSPSFRAHTSNGRIEAHTSLTSASSSGGSFDVSTTTSNAPVVVNFPASPVDSKLRFEASTSNAAASVSLHPAYEGSFDLRTSISKPTVRRKDGVEDPSGQGRTRVVEYKNVGRPSTSGNIYWGDGERKSEGTVIVHTSISPVLLEV